MQKNTETKLLRILSVYSRLLLGNGLSKKEISLLFNISEKTVQRDLDYLRYYLNLDKNLHHSKLIYDRSKHKYFIVKEEEEEVV